jgi:hypothetical protein
MANLLSKELHIMTNAASGTATVFVYLFIKVAAVWPYAQMIRKI